MPRISKKNLIIQTATQLFAEKGYDATGMEEIASKLEIPKSLIYYHFKSKEDLLNVIVTGFIEEYNRILHDGKERGIDKISVYIEFLKQNRDCAKILISESLKAGSNQNLLLKTLNPLMELETKQVPGNKSSNKFDNAHWQTEFFTSILPSIMFVCYENSWRDYFGVSEEQMEKDYYTAYKLTHGAYHEHIEKESL